MRRERRWCDYCFKLTPDADLLWCSGCKTRAYCLPPAQELLGKMASAPRKHRLANLCQNLDWHERHKHECDRRLLVEADSGRGRRWRWSECQWGGRGW